MDICNSDHEILYIWGGISSTQECSLYHFCQTKKNCVGIEFDMQLFFLIHWGKWTNPFLCKERESRENVISSHRSFSFELLSATLKQSDRRETADLATWRASQAHRHSAWTSITESQVNAMMNAINTLFIFSWMFFTLGM